MIKLEPGRDELDEEDDEEEDEEEDDDDVVRCDDWSRLCIAAFPWLPSLKLDMAFWSCRLYWIIWLR